MVITMAIEPGAIMKRNKLKLHRHFMFIAQFLKQKESLHNHNICESSPAVNISYSQDANKLIINKYDND